MSDTKTYGRGTIILRQGEPGDCMYVVQSGRVGIFQDYGQPQEKKIAELMSGEYFGEMSLLDHEPRSATAVVLDSDTMLTTVTEETFLSFFKENPAKVLMLAQQMCHRLRRTTEDYVEACKTVYESVEADKTGAPKSEGLLERIGKLCTAYLNFVRKGD